MAPRRPSDDSFVQAHTYVAVDLCIESDLTPVECALLKELRDVIDERHQRQRAWCFTSLDELAERTRWKRDAVANALDGLMTHGLITQRRVKGHGTEVWLLPFPAMVHMPEDTRKALYAEIGARRRADFIDLARESAFAVAECDQGVSESTPLVTEPAPQVGESECDEGVRPAFGESECDQGIVEPGPYVGDSEYVFGLADMRDAQNECDQGSPLCSEGALREDVSKEGVGIMLKANEQHLAALEEQGRIDRSDRSLFAPDGDPWCHFGKGFGCLNGEACMNPNHRAPKEAGHV